MNMHVHFFAMRMMMTLGVVSVLAGPVASAESIIFVDDDAPSGGDGMSWNTAYRFLSDALTAGTSLVESEIRIAQGTYFPDESDSEPLGSGERMVSFTVTGGMWLRGGFAGIGANNPDFQDATSFVTVLSGDLDEDDDGHPVSNEDNSLHVVTITAEGYGVSILDSLDIRHGNADIRAPGLQEGAGVYAPVGELKLKSCNVQLNSAAIGGGVYIGPSVNATVELCNFEFNSGSNGGALMNDAGIVYVYACSFTFNSGIHGGGIQNGPDGAMLCTDTAFRLNGAAEGAAIKFAHTSIGYVSTCTFFENAGFEGRGIYVNDGFLTVTDCTFLENDAGGEAGGALYSSGQDVKVLRCEFIRNSGGAVSVLDSFASHYFQDCIFFGNSAVRGGAIESENSDFVVVGSVFAGNQADDKGGAIYNGGHLFPEPVIISCTFIGNVADGPRVPSPGGGVFNVGSSNPTIINSILYNNMPDDAGGSAEPDWESSLIGESLFGAGSAQLDPEVRELPEPGDDGTWGTADDDYGDLQLLPHSPAIDAGQNGALPPDIAADILGHPRFIDIQSTVDCALGGVDCGIAPIIDIGAYEFQGISCPGDLTNDGIVGPTDLALLLGQWGTDGSADIHDDDMVGPSDLAVLLGTWGPCS